VQEFGASNEIAVRAFSGAGVSNLRTGVSPNTTTQPELYDILISAYQQRTGNTGVGRVTVIIPAPTPTK